MAFWGIEIKPGKPYIHRYEYENGRLHVSQATLGTGSSTKKSIVQCKVGDKNPIYLCSLLPERIETCALNLEFEEDDEVMFSVNGPQTVHLSGFFYGEDEDQDNVGDYYGSDLYDGNIVGSDFEDEDDSIGYDSNDDEEDDDLLEDDLGMFPHSPIPNSGVKIEEIADDKEITNESALSKQGRKKKNQSDISDGNGNSNHQTVVKAGSGVPVLESEDEDGFPVISARVTKFDFSNSASKSGKTCERMDNKTKRKKETDEVACGKSRKRKNDSLGQEREPDRDNDEPHDSSVQPDKIVPKNDVKKKKKKSSEKEDSGKESGTLNSNAVEKLPEGEIGNDLGPNKKKKKGKKSKKQSKEGESAVTVKADQTLTNGKESSMEKEEKEEIKSSQLRTFPNGLSVEEVSMGKPNGKRASPGTKISVFYIGKLKKNGKIFDSNIGRAPFKFRLGIGQVIKGWDVGVNGMRIGDKRRLTIPPAMGYGAKGCGPAIPPNSWLVFDVELVDVN